MATKMPNMKIDVPNDPTFWKALALDAQRVMRSRTGGQGLDHRDRAFKPYKPATLVDRSKRGRTSWVNLTDTGRMLGGMTALGQSKKGKVVLAGAQGAKAYFNELKGRTFFALSKKQQKGIIKRVADWIVKKNK